MAQTTENRGIWAWDIVKWVLIGAGILYASFFYFLGFTEEGTRACIAWSAKISFVLFCMAFSASVAHRLLKNSFSFWWLMNRKYFGISFALSHLLHLGFLGILQKLFHPVFNLAQNSSLLGGGIAYFFIVAMLLTSFDTFSKYLTKKQWKLLHFVGTHWVWAIFLVTYFKRVGKGEYEYLPYVLVLVGVLILRLLVGKNKNIPVS